MGIPPEDEHPLHYAFGHRRLPELRERPRDERPPLSGLRVQRDLEAVREDVGDHEERDEEEDQPRVPVERHARRFPEPALPRRHPATDEHQDVELVHRRAHEHVVEDAAPRLRRQVVVDALDQEVQRPHLQDDEAPVDQRVQEPAVPVTKPRDARIADEVRDQRYQPLAELPEAPVPAPLREDGHLDRHRVDEERHGGEEGDVVDPVPRELM